VGLARQAAQHHPFIPTMPPPRVKGRHGGKVGVSALLWEVKEFLTRVWECKREQG